jgi:hypothetical protein
VIRRAGLAALLALGVTPGDAEAVAVSPSALYLDQRSRSGTMTLFNSGSLPEEIDIGFAYGYPRSDSLGNVTVPIDSVAPVGDPSLVPWARAFPRRLRLAPGQRQVVRIMVEPPAGLPAGEYWGRVVVTARGGQPPIEERRGDITLQVELRTVIVAAVTYRTGEVRTGIAVRAGQARRVEGGVEMLIDLAREGNAAFIGRVVAQVIAPDGKIVAEESEFVAVYRELRAKVMIPLPTPLPPGPGYQVRFTIDTHRPDLPVEGPLPAQRRTGLIPL